MRGYNKTQKFKLVSKAVNYQLTTCLYFKAGYLNYLLLKPHKYRFLRLIQRKTLAMLLASERRNLNRVFLGSRAENSFLRKPLVIDTQPIITIPHRAIGKINCPRPH